MRCYPKHTVGHAQDEGKASIRKLQLLICPPPNIVLHTQLMETSASFTEQLQELGMVEPRVDAAHEGADSTAAATPTASAVAAAPSQD